MSDLLQYPRKRIVRRDDDCYEFASLHSNYNPPPQPPPYDEHHAISDPSHSYSSRHSSPIPVPRNTSNPVEYDSGLSFAESSRCFHTPNSYEHLPSRLNTYDMHDYSINYSSTTPPQIPLQNTNTPAIYALPAHRAPMPRDPQSSHHRDSPQSRSFRYSPPLRQTSGSSRTDERTSCPYCQKVVWVRGLQVHTEFCQKARAALRPAAAPSDQSHAYQESSRPQTGQLERGRKRLPHRRRAVGPALPRRQPDVDVTIGRYQKTPSPQYLRHLP